MWLKQKTQYTACLPDGTRHYGLTYETASRLLIEAGVPRNRLGIFKTSDFYTKEVRGIGKEAFGRFVEGY